MSDRRDKKDRRTRSERRRYRVRCVGSTRTAVLEVSRLHLRVVIIDRHEGDFPDRVHAETVMWNSSSQSLHAPEGQEKLVKGLKQIATECDLQGLNLKVVLSGEFCITPAIRGACETVRSALQRLE